MLKLILFYISHCFLKINEYEASTNITIVSIINNYMLNCSIKLNCDLLQIFFNISKQIS